MTDRLTMPSALPAEYSERKSDQTHCYVRRPTYAELQASSYRLREELDATQRELARYVKLIRDVTDLLVLINGEMK